MEPLVKRSHEKPTAKENALVRAFLVECFRQQSFRCPSCLNHCYMLGNWGIYRPLDGGESIAYGVCLDCWRKANVNDVALRRFLDRCEVYLEQGEVQT